MRTPAAIVIALSLVACGNGVSESKLTSAAPEAAQPAAESHAEDVHSADRKLALAKVVGDSKVDQAVTVAQEAARKNPTKEDVWIMLGRAWVKKARQSSDPGFYLNAKASAHVALEITPGSKVALDLETLVLLNDHKFEAARALAASVVAKHPEDPMAYGNLSDALLEMGRYDEATEAAQTMIDLKPNLPSYSRASYLQWLRGDSKGSKESVRLAIDAGTDTRDKEPRAWVLVQAATIFFQEGDYEGAAAGFEQALSWDPGFPPALVGRGRVAMAKGEPKVAVGALEESYAASPLVETAWLLGDARKMAGDEKGAADAYALVEKEGKSGDPRTLSLFLSTKNQKPELALSLARQEHEVRKDIMTDDALAWALYRNGRMQEAKEMIARARRLGTNDARILFHEGAIRIATGDADEGKKLVAKSLALSPKFDVSGAAEARSLLAQK